MPRLSIYPFQGPYRYLMVLGIFILLLLLEARVAFCENDAYEKIAIIVSSEIQPYLDALEGINEVLKEQTDVDIAPFFPENMDEKRSVALAARLSSNEFSAFIAVGPEAALFLWKEVKRPGAVVRLYTMVLNPEGVIPQVDIACGVSLNIPVKEQLDQIHQSLPGLKRIGILYDPKNNQSFYDLAARDSAKRPFEMISVPVSSTPQIPTVLRGIWKRLDGLWLIPDQTVISESLVQFMIKEAIANGVVVIGYNRFFYKHGAGMAMVMDYRGIGRQTAFLLLERLSGKQCGMPSPVFEAIVNKGILEKLGVRFAE